MIFLNDTFTDNNNTVLASHTGEVGATWSAHASTPSASFTVVNNAIRCGTAGIMQASGAPPGPDYDIEVDYLYKSSAGNAAIVWRLDAEAATYYMFRMSSGDDWQLHKVVGGTATLLDSVDAGTPSGSYVIRIECRKGSQAVYVDGVAVCEAADNDITAAGLIGVRDTGTMTDSTGKHIDMIRASSPATRPGVVLAPGQSPLSILTPS